MDLFRKASIAAVLLLVGLPAWAACTVTQTTPQFTAGGTVFGRIASQWNAYFGSKTDANGGTACNLNLTGTPQINGSPVVPLVNVQPPLAIGGGVLEILLGSEYQVVANFLRPANIPNNTILGNVSGGSAIPGALSESQLATLLPASALAKMRVFAIGGQSNALGTSADVRLAPAMPSGKVYQWYSGALTAITSDPIGASNGATPWSSFANTYLAAHPGDIILFVPSAVGGTDQTYLTGISTTNWGPAGDPGATLAPALVMNVTSAMAAARAAGFDPVYSGILWAQSEDEAGVVNVTPPTLSYTTVTGGPYSAGVTAITVASGSNISTNNIADITLDDGSILATPISISGTNVTLSKAVPASRQILNGAVFHIFNAGDYENGFRAMLSYFRSVTTAGTTFPTLPVYVSLVGAPGSGDNAQYQAIRAAQRRVIQSDPYTKLGYANAYTFASRGMMQGNCSFTGAIAATVLSASGTGQCTTPIIQGAGITGSGVDATTVVTALGANSYGGDGTYTVTPSQTISSEAMSTSISNLHYLAEGYAEMGRAMAGSAVAAEQGSIPAANDNYNVFRLTPGGTKRLSDQFTIVITSSAVSGSPYTLGPVTITDTAEPYCTYLQTMATNFTYYSPNLAAAGITAKAFCPSGEAAYLEVYQSVALSPQATLSSSWITAGATETMLITTGTTEAGGSGPWIVNGGMIVSGTATFNGPIAVSTFAVGGATVASNTAPFAVWDSSGNGIANFGYDSNSGIRLYQSSHNGPAYVSQIANSTLTLNTNNTIGSPTIGLTIHASNGATIGAVSDPGANNFAIQGTLTADGIGYPTSATSGGVVYASSTTQFASSGLMPLNHAILGGGAGASPVDSKVTITPPATGSTLTIADGKTLTDTSGVGANILLGATGGGFASYGGASACSAANFVTAISAAGATTCGSSTISGVALGANLATLSYGTHLTNSAGASSYNGSAASTIATDATNANTVSTIVARDSSGNFSAGTITASLTGLASLNLPLTGGTLSGQLKITGGVDNTAGSAHIGWDATAGAQFLGTGTGQDVTIYNKNGAAALFITTGTTVVTAVGGFSANGTAGVDCTGVTAGTVVVTKGLVTHC